MEALLKVYVDKIRKLDPQGRVIHQVSLGMSDLTVKVIVTNAWHLQPYPVRLQMAQTLWLLWTSVCSAADPDKVYIKIVDVKGNSVGGSGLAGSLVEVSKK